MFAASFVRQKLQWECCWRRNVMGRSCFNTQGWKSYFKAAAQAACRLWEASWHRLPFFPLSWST